MIKKTQIIIDLPQGLHARPSAKIVNLLKLYKAKVYVLYGEQECIADSLFNLLSLCIPHKAIVTLKAEGPQADEALKALVDLNRNNYN